MGERRAAADAALGATRDTLAALAAEARRLEIERSNAEAANAAAGARVEQERAAAARLEADAARAQEEAEAARATYAEGRERLDAVRQQSAQLEMDRIRTVAQLKADRQQTADAPAPQGGADLPRWRLRGTRLAVAGAFAAAVATIYLIPRYWPQQTHGVPAPQAGAPDGATARAGIVSGASSAPLYADDSAAQRDLRLSYQLDSGAAGGTPR